jgi:cytochrome c-type biogenesis protein CcmF
MITVLLGTLYPLFADALNLGKISVGPPYFNFFFVPFTVLLGLFMAVGPLTLWKKTSAQRLWKALKSPLFLSLLTASLFPILYGDSYKITAAITVFIGSWITYVTLADLYRKAQHRDNLRQGLGKLTRSYYGMVVAHLGVAVAILGAGLNTIYSDQRDLRMEVGQEVSVGSHRYHLVDIQQVRGPNYTAQRGVIDIYQDERFISQLKPEKRRYFSTNDVMTEAAIDSGLFGDLYIAMGEPLEVGQSGNAAWAIRIHDKPFVTWIWFGALLMATGGFLAISDKRYRLKKKLNKKLTAARSIATS